jgi:antitoxin component YwqK of YwqJK toxin-antitoxin module
MKYFASFILSVLLYFNTNAQATPVYFSGDQITTDKSRANSYAIYGKLSDEDIWTFKRYDLDNNLIQTGSYSDSQLSIPHGKFVFYMYIDYFNKLYQANFRIPGKTRFISQQGNFVNGVEHGRWLLFFPDGNVFNRQDYVNGKLHGEFVTYDKLGNVDIQGNYVDGEREGEWIIDEGERKVVYEKGVVKSNEFVKKNKKGKQTKN